MERRFIQNKLERAAGDLNPDGLPLKFGGVAAVVNSITDMGWYEERIEAGAFDDALKSSDLDCRCLFNHEDEMILGRTTSGTLRLSVNDNGALAYEYDADYRSPLHTQVACAIERRDITQSSFAFTIESVEWSYSEKYGEMGLRTIKKIKKLYDVSPVTYPAYEDTEADSRSALKEERSKFSKPDENVTAEKEKEFRNSLDLCKLIKTK